MIRLPRSKGQNSIDVRIFKVRILLKDRFPRLASRHQAKNVSDRNAQAAYAWTAMHTIGIDRYSFQKVGQGQYHLLIIAPSLTIVSPWCCSPPLPAIGER